MTLEEAILDIEGRFEVHREAGFDVVSRDQNGRTYETGAKDMSRAPCGERYVTFLSTGEWDGDGPPPMLFSNEEEAVNWWRGELIDYAEETGGNQLYWREPPRYEETEYVAMNQVSLIQQQGSPLQLTVTLGTVYSRLVVTDLLPDGTKETDPPPVTNWDRVYSPKEL